MLNSYSYIQLNIIDDQVEVIYFHDLSAPLS